MALKVMIAPLPFTAKVSREPSTRTTLPLKADLECAHPSKGCFIAGLLPAWITASPSAAHVFWAAKTEQRQLSSNAMTRCNFS